MNVKIGFALSLIVSAIVTVILAKKFIPVLKSIKMGQKILDIGPRWHKSKEGTPTMGGLFFISGTLIPAVAAFAVTRDGSFLIHYIFVLFNGLIGFVDDYVKFFKKQNKGLSAIQKLVLQFAVGAAYLCSLSVSGNISTLLRLPFGISVDMGILYYAIVLVGIVFTVNSTNLTDGIDGLCASITAVIMLFFSVMCIKGEYFQESVFCAAILGGMIGFLVYNFHPAKVFMGDTGSLFIGGAVCAAAFMLDIPIILVLFGIVYYIESISVMIQVLSFKLTKKRVFKMTPIHHHFEMSGWNEVKIVFVFSLVTAIFCVAGCFLFLGCI